MIIAGAGIVVLAYVRFDWNENPKPSFFSLLVCNFDFHINTKSGEVLSQPGSFLLLLRTTMYVF